MNWRKRCGRRCEPDMKTIWQNAPVVTQAEIIATYVKKGQELYIRGRIDNRTYEKKDGTKGYTSEIIVEDFQLGARARGEAGAAGGDGSQVRTAAEAVHEASITQGHDDGIRIEDIPF